MSRTITELRVFIASPSGLDTERRTVCSVIEKYNEEDARPRGYLFVPVGWERVLGGVGRPQSRIDQELIKCDYFILILHDRWGSSPGIGEEGNYSSGSEEEFAQARKCFDDPDKPMRDIIIFFKSVNDRQLNDPGPQLKKVLDFKKDLQESKKYLFQIFSSNSSFQNNVIRPYLANWLRDEETAAKNRQQHETEGMHVQFLRHNVSSWNDFRHRNPGVQPDLQGARLKKANLNSIDLSNAILVDADLRSANLKSAIMSGADLRGARLDEADLSNADLSGATLVGATLRGAKLENTNLERSDLQIANLQDAFLRKARLSGARVGRTIFTSPSLAEADGLDRLIHYAVSDISIGIMSSLVHKMPTSVLERFGVPLSLTEPLPVKTLEFYSCFISYSHEDKFFARRLHDELQSYGIRCWLDEHQILPGDDIYEQIDHGIKLSDKLLLCCSEASLTSWWVDNEISSAFEKERRLTKEDGRRVLALMPLNLDDFMFSGKWQSDIANLVKARLAADFTGWETNNAKFEAEFKKLVQALRADEYAREKPPSRL